MNAVLKEESAEAARLFSSRQLQRAAAMAEWALARVKAFEWQTCAFDGDSYMMLCDPLAAQFYSGPGLIYAEVHAVDEKHDLRVTAYYSALCRHVGRPTQLQINFRGSPLVQYKSIAAWIQDCYGRVAKSHGLVLANFEDGRLIFEIQASPSASANRAIKEYIERSEPRKVTS
jgi:hypothetical protein